MCTLRSGWGMRPPPDENQRQGQDYIEADRNFESDMRVRFVFASVHWKATPVKDSSWAKAAS